jgi:hypothetical protein
MLKSQRLKKFSAIAGSIAFGVMVVLGAGLAERQTATGTTVSDPGLVTLGETATTTTPPAQPVTSKATPPFTFTTPSGFAAPH